MRLLAWTFLWTSCFIVCLAGNSRATFEVVDDLPCPACKTVCRCEMVSSYYIKAVDLDLYIHTRDWWPAYGVPTTCPRCLYSGYYRDFMDVKLSDGLKKQIVRDRILRPLELITKGAKSGDIDYVVKRDLIAQVYKLRGMDNLELAKQYLIVSWTIRRMSYPFEYLPEHTLARLKEHSDTHVFNDNQDADNPGAAKRIECAMKVWKQAKSPFLMLAGIESVIGIDPKLAYELFANFAKLSKTEDLRDFKSKMHVYSLRLMRYYRLALKHYRLALKGRLEDADRFRVLYLCGEISRRLHKLGDARAYFERARAMKLNEEEHGSDVETINHFLKMQRQLIKAMEGR